MVFLISVLGIYSGSKLPMEFLQRHMDQPRIVTITTLSEGLDAEAMTKEVTEPLEKQYRNLSHVDTITSSTSEGLSKIEIMPTPQRQI